MDTIIGQLKRHQAETKTRILTTGSTEKGWGEQKVATLKIDDESTFCDDEEEVYEC